MKSTHNGEVRITSLIVDELAKALRKILKLDGPADVLMSLYFKNARHLGHLLHDASSFDDHLAHVAGLPG